MESTKICPVCEEEFTPRTRGGRGKGRPQVYCSPACRSRSANGAWRDRNRPDRAANFAECGGPVVHRTDTGRPRRFCSDQCKQRASNRRANRARLPVRERNPDEKPCAHCGNPFTPKRRDRIYCYDSYCAQAAYQKRRRSGEGRRIEEHTVSCGECGTEFTAKYPTARWCSKLCANRHWGRVRSRRRRELSSTPYTDREIFERDGWRCHLCKKVVKKDADRTDPDGATIDHLVPISLGGDDEPGNVATAHRRCNLDKRVRAMNEQLAFM